MTQRQIRHAISVIAVLVLGLAPKVSVGYKVQCRRIQLLAGRPPKQQLPAYKMVDDEVADAKLRYNMNISALFVHFLQRQRVANIPPWSN